MELVFVYGTLRTGEQYQDLLENRKRLHRLNISIKGFLRIYLYKHVSP
jgi:gamma-glutamylcyclotransferase (GGCT)/AIG2-like uncharacterized protein YtfP